MTAKTIYSKLNKLRHPSKQKEKPPASTLVLAAEAGIHLLLAAVLAGAAIFEDSAPFGAAFVGASGSGLYGGAALVDEMQRGGVSRADARLLNTHVAISHSLLEDTIVFASAGIGLFWLLVPRLLLAVVAVWTLRGLRMLGRRREGRTAPTGK